MSNWRKKWKNFKFRMGLRPLFRDADHTLGIPLPRVIWKTPKLKGKRLVLKGKEPHPENERAAREWVRKGYPNYWMNHHTLHLSKRFTQIRGKRVEIYYDRPSLTNALEMVRNRRMQDWLKTNHLTKEQLQEKAMQAWNELDHAFSLLHPGADLRPDQILVDRIDAHGKLHLILVDA